MTEGLFGLKQHSTCEKVNHSQEIVAIQPSHSCNRFQVFQVFKEGGHGGCWCGMRLSAVVFVVPSGSRIWGILSRYSRTAVSRNQVFLLEGCSGVTVVKSVQFWLSKKQNVMEYIYLLLFFQPLVVFICYNWVKCAAFVCECVLWETCPNGSPLDSSVSEVVCYSTAFLPLLEAVPLQRRSSAVWANWGTDPGLNVQSRDPECLLFSGWYAWVYLSLSLIGLLLIRRLLA